MHGNRAISIDETTIHANLTPCAAAPRIKSLSSVYLADYSVSGAEYVLFFSISGGAEGAAREVGEQWKGRDWKEEGEQPKGGICYKDAESGEMFLMLQSGSSVAGVRGKFESTGTIKILSGLLKELEGVRDGK